MCVDNFDEKKEEEDEEKYQINSSLERVRMYIAEDCFAFLLSLGSSSSMLLYIYLPGVSDRSELDRGANTWNFSKTFFLPFSQLQLLPLLLLMLAR